MLEFRELKIEKYPQSGFLIEGINKSVYIDPFRMDGKIPADYVLITHDHFDHYDPDSFGKLLKAETVFVVAESVAALLERDGYGDYQIVTMRPGATTVLPDITISAIPAYNISKDFHPQRNEWVGFDILLDNTRVVHLGDSDNIEEYSSLNPAGDLDVLMVPVSGTYVMTSQEAIEAANLISPALAIPMHHDAGSVGSMQDADDFASGFTGQSHIFRNI